MPTEFRPLEKEKMICGHFDHKMPTHYVYPPGHYRHTCPACGHVQEFSVYPVTS